MKTNRSYLVSMVISVLLFGVYSVTSGSFYGGGLLGGFIMLASTLYAWRAFVLNTRSPWVRRFVKIRMVSFFTFILILLI